MEISDADLLCLASTITHFEYFKFGYELGFSYAELDNKRVECLGDVSEAMYHLLMRWKARQEPGIDLMEELNRRLMIATLSNEGLTRHSDPRRPQPTIPTAAIILVSVISLCLLGLLLYSSPCASGPCQNGGTCKDFYSCVCRNGYEGERCEKDVCSSASCHHGGTCQQLETTYRCICPPGRGGVQCETEYITDNLSLPECQQILRDHYELHNFKIQLKPWDPQDYVKLEEIYTTITVHEQDKSDLSRPAKRKGTLKELLYTIHDRRVVLVGDAGRGKSTAVAKIAHDWANNVTGNFFQNHTLLFVLKMRHVKETTTFAEEIVRLLGKKYIGSETQLQKYIDDNERRVGVIFDGYDEFTGSVEGGGHKSDIVDILRHNRCKQCKVLVTTRPFREVDFYVGDLSFVYSKVVLEGYSNDQAMKFIDKYFESNQAMKRGLKEYLENEPIISELMTTPLFCTMVCYMWREDRLKGTCTKSSFFDNIMYFLLKHAKAKPKAILPESVDLDDLLCRVGEVAFDKLSEGGDERPLLFTDKDFKNVTSYKDTSLKLGLLTTTMDLDEDFILFIEFFHKLALEYSAGKYFSFAAINGKMGAWRGKTILELGIFQVLEFAAGASESACEKILGYIAKECSLRRSSVCGSQSYEQMILSLISEAENMCAENMIEATSPSLFGLNGTLDLGCPKASAVVGFGKLPQHVKNKMIEVSVDVSDWTTSIFKKFWKNCANCSRLSHLKMSFHTPPTIPNDEEKLYTVKRFTISLPIQPSGMNPKKVADRQQETELWMVGNENSLPRRPQDLDPSLLSMLFKFQVFNWLKPDVPILKDISQIFDRMSTYISRFTSHFQWGSSERKKFRTLSSDPVPSKPVKEFRTKVASSDIVLQLLSKMPNLEELVIIPKNWSFEDTKTESSAKIFMRFWNRLSLHPKLSILELNIGHFPLDGMQALKNITTFRTIVDDDPWAFADIFPYLPELVELSVTVKRSLDDVLILAFDAPLKSQHLKRINVTYNAGLAEYRPWRQPKETLRLSTLQHVQRLTSELRADSVIQELRIRTVEKCYFAESQLVELVESAKLIRSLEHLGIPCAVNGNGDLDRYLAPICKTHLLSKMTEGEKRKFLIRLTLYPKTISNSEEKTCFLRRY